MRITKADESESDSDEESLATALVGPPDDLPPRIKVNTHGRSSDDISTLTNDVSTSSTQPLDKMRARIADVSSRFGSTLEVLGSKMSSSMKHVNDNISKANSINENVEDDNIQIPKNVNDTTSKDNSTHEKVDDNSTHENVEDDDLQTWSDDAPFRDETRMHSHNSQQPIGVEATNSGQLEPGVTDSWWQVARSKIFEKGAEVSTSFGQSFHPPERSSANESSRLSRSACGPDGSKGRLSRDACSAPRWPSMKSQPRPSTESVSSDDAPVVNADNHYSTFGAVTRTLMAGRRNLKEFQNATSEALETLDERFKISETVADLDQNILDGAGEKARQKLKETGASAESQQRKQMIWSALNKTFVKAVSRISSPRPFFRSVDPGALCYYDASLFPGVSGIVALTIDDAPCSQDDPGQCLLKEVRELLAEFDAKATFFLCTDYVPGHEDELVEMLRHGHEIGNHGGEDRSYSADSEDDFEKLLVGWEQVCERVRRAAAKLPVEPSLQLSDENSVASETHIGDGSDDLKASCDVQSCRSSEIPAESAVKDLDSSGNCDMQCPADVVLPQRPVRLFRAPHADASPAMIKVLQRHGFTNVLCDCFANDTNIKDSKFIADAMLDSLDPDGGSIMVLHMPERGFREHNLETLRLLLEGLQKKHMRILTVSGLTDAAWAGGFRSQGNDVPEQVPLVASCNVIPELASPEPEVVDALL